MATETETNRKQRSTLPVENKSSECRNVVMTVVVNFFGNILHQIVIVFVIQTCISWKKKFVYSLKFISMKSISQTAFHVFKNS